MGNQIGGNIIRAFEAGRRARMEREQMGQQEEDRKLQREILQQQIRQLKIDEKLQRRQAQLGAAQLQEGRPGETAPGIPAQFTPEQPTNIKGLLATLPPSITPGIPEQELPHPSVALEGIPELGVPEQTFQPRNQRELLEQLALQKRIQNEVSVPGFGEVDVRTLPALLGNLREAGSERRFEQREAGVERRHQETLGRERPGVDVPFSAEVESQKARLAQAGRTPSSTEELANAVAANPTLFNQLSPTAKASIIPKLNRQGFTQFGKPLSDGAIKQINESEVALESLKDLRRVLQEFEPYIGPVAGLSALNPYSEARKAQARIDAVRQRVGKALEGGVLRKEDEEKYKKIIAVLRDTPETAIFKVDGLIKDLERQMELFLNSQSAAGRNITGQRETEQPQQLVGPDGKVLTLQPDGLYR